MIPDYAQSDVVSCTISYALSGGHTGGVAMVHAPPVVQQALVAGVAPQALESQPRRPRNWARNRELASRAPVCLLALCSCV